MARVTGIGGVFLRSPDPKRMTQWYVENLGIELTSWGGVNFEWKDDVLPQDGSTALTAFAADSTSFGETTQQAMVNYRVDDLDALLKKLEAAGVWIDPKRDNADFGKFAWIKDCDGNRVELWQPLAG